MLNKPLRNDDSELQNKVIRQAEKTFKRETLATKRAMQNLAFEKLLIFMKYSGGNVKRHHISAVVKLMEHPSVTYRTLKYRLDRARACPMKLDSIALRVLYPNIKIPNYVAVSVFSSGDGDDDDDDVYDDNSIDDSTLSDYFNKSHSIASRPWYSKPMTARKLVAPPIPTDIVIRPLTHNNSNDSLY
jgi:hypothetical protein